MEKNKQLAVQTAEEKSNSLLVFGSEKNFEAAMRMAKALSASSIVPKAYSGQDGFANSIIALEMANRIGVSPLMVMQNLYVVHGTPSWSSKFLIACLNKCNKFSPLRYEEELDGDIATWRTRAYATDLANGEVLKGTWVSIEMAKSEGWYDKPGSKWKTMPQLMLQYRAAAFFQRVYAPEISMGMNTVEEANDIVDVTYEEVAAPNGVELCMEEETPAAQAPTKEQEQPKREEAPTNESDAIPAIFD